MHSLPTRSRKIWLTIATVTALFVAATMVTAIYLVTNGHRTAVNRAEQQALRFIHGAEVSLNRGLLGVDVLLATVDDLLQLSSLVRDKIDPEQASRLLRGSVEQNLLVRYVALMSPNGKVMASSDRDGQQLDVALPAGFLASILSHPVYTVVMSEPMATADEPEGVLFLGRTVSLADGSKVVTVAQIQVHVLASIMAQGLGTDGLEITLERHNGALLVSVPPAGSTTAKARPSTLSELISTGAVDILPSRLTGAPSFVVARRTLYQDAWISVAIPVDAALAPWRTERNYIIGMTALIALLTTAASVFAGWYLLRLGRVADSLTQSKRILDQALNAMDSGFLLLDPQGRVVSWNQRFEEIFPELVGAMAAMLPYHQTFEVAARLMLPNADDDTRQAWIERRLEYHQSAQAEHEQAYPDGRVILISERTTPDGGRVCVFRDVAEERKAEADLRVAATAFESQEGMLVTDSKRRILRVNRAFTEITGYTAQDVVGKSPRVLSSGAHDVAFYEAMWRSIRDTGTWHGEVLNRRKDGGLFHEHLTVTAVKDEYGAVTHYVANMIDVTLNRAAAEEIERLAFYDPLTELPNRRLLMDRLRQALASSARDTRHGALLFLDLDHFKVLNDTLGHDVGDVLLREVAKRLTSSVRECDTVARLGGDEFVVLLEELSGSAIEAGEEIQALGEKLLGKLNQAYALGANTQHCSCSIGAVLFSGKHQSLDDLLKQADLAMYDAKTAGRNTLRFFDPQMQASMSARAVLEKSLREALSNQEFELHYQAQVTHSGRTVGAEVLIRWRHPERGLVPPAEFIPLAEETGLILPIGLWVLQTACAQLKVWESNPDHAGWQLAVNVSARQFRQPDFVQQVKTVLQQTGACAQLLKLELTETMVLSDVDDTVAKMHALRSLGVRFSMDDFGTGQSSLSHLTKLPLDQLKIDQSFVRNIGIKPADALIVQTIIGMAHNLGLEIIAEGVETQEQRAFLEQHGCALCQGYLFARPMPLADFERQADRHRLNRGNTTSRYGSLDEKLRQEA